MIVSAGLDKSLFIWDVETLTKITNINNVVTSNFIQITVGLSIFCKYLYHKKLFCFLKSFFLFFENFILVRENLFSYTDMQFLIKTYHTTFNLKMVTYELLFLPKKLNY